MFIILTMEADRREFFKCHQPIYLPLFCTGILPFRLNAKYNFETTIFTRVLTLLIRLVSLGTFLTGAILKVISHDYSQQINDLSPLIKIIIFSEMFMALITYVEVVFSLEMQNSKHMELYEHAFELDRSISKEFPINFNYHKTVGKNRFYMGVITIYCATYYMLYILLNLEPEWKSALIAIGYSLFTIGPGGCSYAHISFMDFLRIRFRLLQKMLKRCPNSNLDADSGQRKQIFALMNHYKRYHKLIQQINVVYGQMAIFIYFHDFTQISSMVFVLCHKAAESKSDPSEYILLFLFVVPRIFKIAYTAIYSRSTVIEMFAAFADVGSTRKERESIDAFLLWRKHNPLNFRIGHLVLNLGFAYAFVNGIANHILILIQLKSQELAIEERISYKFSYRAELKTNKLV